MRKLLIIALMITGYAATGQHIRHNQLRPLTGLVFEKCADLIKDLEYEERN